nr:MAG: hypothetical protein DIU67_03415 [Actinomycetota bacterium]
MLGLRDTLGLVFYETSGVLTDDDWWAYWKGVLMDELPGLIGHEMLLTTPEGMSLCRVEQICNGQTLVEGIGPAPF